jgi:hypothetical protein
MRQPAGPVSGPPSAVVSRKALDEILTPVREEFEKNRMTDEDLVSLVEDIREEIWQEKQAQKGQ